MFNFVHPTPNIKKNDATNHSLATLEVAQRDHPGLGPPGPRSEHLRFFQALVQLQGLLK